MHPLKTVLKQKNRLELCTQLKKQIKYQYYYAKTHTYLHLIYTLNLNSTYSTKGIPT